MGEFSPGLFKRPVEVLFQQPHAILKLLDGPAFLGNNVVPLRLVNDTHDFDAGHVTTAILEEQA